MRERWVLATLALSVVAAVAAAQPGPQAATPGSDAQGGGTLVESYEYDYEGRRIEKAGPGGVLRYVWDGDEILLETDDSGNTIARYAYTGDRPLAVIHATEGTAFYLVDGLGSPVGLSEASGALAARYSYDAWGSLRQQAGQCSNSFLFTGYQFDEATGLYYAKARFYDPELGRFLTSDPVAGGIFEPPSLHPYLYAYANPTVYVDPDGRCVGSLQRTELCQAIARGLAFVIAGDPVADAEREVERRAKVVEGRRAFRAEMGRDPLPDEVVWSQDGRALTSGFEEIDTSGRIEPDRAEWAVVAAGIGTRMAVAGARAAGAGATEQILTGAGQLTDEAVGEIVGVSPGDVAGLVRLARRPSSGPAGAMVVVESPGGGVDLAPSGNVSAAPFAAGRATVGGSRSAAEVVDSAVAAEDAGRAVRYAPVKPGPLPDAVARTFRSSSYTAHVVSQPTVLYRAYGGRAGALGQFWTRTRPSGPLQAQVDLALRPEWGNTAVQVIEIRVPAGTKIYEGAAAGQGDLLGGGNQVFIPAVDPSWVVP